METQEKPARSMSTEEFLEKLKGRKIRIIPRIAVELENGETLQVEADCSGCNNANIVLDATFERRAVGDDIGSETHVIDV